MSLATLLFAALSWIGAGQETAAAEDPAATGTVDRTAEDLAAAEALDRAAEAFEGAADAYAGTDRHLLRRWSALLSARGGNEDSQKALDDMRESEDRFKEHVEEALQELEKAQDARAVDEDARLHLAAARPKSSSSAAPGLWRDAAGKARLAASLFRGEDPEEKGLDTDEGLEAAEEALTKVFENAEKALHHDAWLVEDLDVAAVLLLLLAALFAMHARPGMKKLFTVLPLLVYAYFLPTVLSNTGIIPIAAPVYGFIKSVLLPASLVLLVLSVDIPAIVRLGKPALVLFLVATVSIVIGGPLAYLLLGWMVPDALADEAWRGLAAVGGSWIGGGANFIAIGESAGASPSMMSMCIVVDVAVAELWMVILLLFAGREKKMDEKIGADRAALEAVRDRIETFEKSVSKPTNLPALLTMLTLAFGTTALAISLKDHLPDIGSVVKGFTWVVLIVTTLSVAYSFTPLRKLEGAGASKVGSAFLYLLIASIGAKAEFRKVLDVPSLVAIGAVWMTFHAIVVLVVRRWMKAPIFFAAVGSKANVGGAASAPILASAFHPALAPVGVMLAVGGYVLGTYAGLLTAQLLEIVARIYA